jgi:oligoribonuclease
MSSTPNRVQSASNLAWIDLEMTGLDQEQHAIIQAALIVTDKGLNVLEELSCDIWQPPEVLSKMSPFVREMHTKTGLLARVEQSRVDLGEAERRLLTVIAGWCTHPAILCGNSVWNDRKFIDRYMPGLGRYLHYRLLDVSTLKVVAGTWYGEGALFKKPKDGQHDALVDIRNSIAELQHYQKTLLR